MRSHHPHRAEITEAIQRVQSLIDRNGVTRATLAQVLAQLLALADRPSWWSEALYPPPSLPELQARYRIHENPDRTYALYLNVMHPGKIVPPHNHTTWACVAAVEGTERNVLYRRIDDGTRPGVARLEVEREVAVRPGTGVALLPDDIHSVHIGGDSPIRHLHLYGRALETLDERITFDIDAETCRIMPIGVKTR